MNRNEIGFAAESYAGKFLETKGHNVLEYNYRKPWGEIDIIAKKDGVLVFVEVKANSRRQDGFSPELRANRSKMQKVIRTARTYLAEKKYPADQEWQIDVISVILGREGESAEFEHFENIEI